MFLHGGVSILQQSNGSKINTKSWVFNDLTWSQVQYLIFKKTFLHIKLHKQIEAKVVSTCPMPELVDLNFKVNCAQRIIMGKEQIVVITAYGKEQETCTSILDLDRKIWNKVNGDTQPSMGGYIMPYAYSLHNFNIINTGFYSRGLDETKIYYIGGIKKKWEPSMAIYEFSEENVWSKLNVKAPFPIISNSTSQFWHLRSKNCTQ